MQFLNNWINKIDNDVKEFRPLRILSEKLGRRPGEIVVASFLIVAFLAVLNILAFVLTTVFSMLYPAFMSYKNLQSKNTKQCKHWLTFWVVMGFLTVFDGIFKWVLSFIPGYYLIKLFFYTWLYYPQTQGCEIVYKNVVGPIYDNIKQKIE